MATKPRTQLKTVEPAAQALRRAVNDTTLAELGLDLNTWKVLTESIFPSATTAEGILLAVRYCQARGLDVLKRPVHVVPMWSKTPGTRGRNHLAWDQRSPDNCCENGAVGWTGPRSLWPGHQACL